MCVNDELAREMVILVALPILAAAAETVEALGMVVNAHSPVMDMAVGPYVELIQLASGVDTEKLMVFFPSLLWATVTVPLLISCSAGSDVEI